jgi:hypothetical protein
VEMEVDEGIGGHAGEHYTAGGGKSKFEIRKSKCM